MNRTNEQRRLPGVTIAVAAMTFAAVAVADEPASPAGATITATVGQLRNRKGTLGCRLYTSPAGFPESSAGTVERRMPITGGTVRCEFARLPPGTYAISVMHDENDNRKLDKNLLGIPTEGYGVSNNHTHAMSSPTWEESRFVVEGGKSIALAITLRY